MLRRAVGAVADRDDAPVSHAHVGPVARRAGAVDDGSPPQGEVEHYVSGAGRARNPSTAPCTAVPSKNAGLVRV